MQNIDTTDEDIFLKNLNQYHIQIEKKNLQNKWKKNWCDMKK